MGTTHPTRTFYGFTERGPAATSGLSVGGGGGAYMQCKLRRERKGPLVARLSDAIWGREGWTPTQRATASRRPMSWGGRRLGSSLGWQLGWTRSRPRLGVERQPAGSGWTGRGPQSSTRAPAWTRRRGGRWRAARPRPCDARAAAWAAARSHAPRQGRRRPSRRRRRHRARRAATR
eukprot:scaffold43107_cov69-Phaeocystis_antarctica.AAC.10